MVKGVKTKAVLLALLGVWGGAILTGVLSVESAKADKEKYNYQKVLTFPTPNGEVKAELKEVRNEPVAVYGYDIKDKKRGVEIKGKFYRIGDYYFFVPFKLENGKLVPVRQEKIGRIPVDISFLKRIEERFKKAGVNVEAGQGKEKVYVVIDALCPFCAQKMEKEYPQLAKKYRVVFIPFAVHREASVKALSCIYTKAKKEGIVKPLEENFKQFQNALKTGKVGEFIKSYDSCKVDQKVKALVQETTKELVENGVKGTPTFFIPKDGKYYVYVGVLPSGVGK